MHSCFQHDGKKGNIGRQPKKKNFAKRWFESRRPHLALAVFVNRRAATVSFSGMSASAMRLSSVMVATATTIGLPFLPLSSREMRETEIGGLLILDWNRRRKMTLLKRESVRRARKR